jgi:2-polyprenyl-3-methyl-5-hydroxy-6-metoxy-1,4-benzoquinol methylase
LDIGCGDGPFIKSLFTNGVDADIIGLDISINMIKLAKKTLDSRAQLLTADAFKLPLRPGVKFDLIHLDSVLHHIISKTRSKSLQLVDSFCKQLTDRLSKNGSMVVEEVYYASYLSPQITSFIIFYGLKFLNILHLDVSKLVEELLPGLEVNFLHQDQIERLLAWYGTVQLVKKTSWHVPRLYRFLLLKELGHVCYTLTPSMDQAPS